METVANASRREPWKGWVEELGLKPAEYGTHSTRRTKAQVAHVCGHHPLRATGSFMANWRALAPGGEPPVVTVGLYASYP